jgi:hypothetical protein
MEHQSQFMSIMAAYGQSFLLPDINIFQQNLQSLESLQAKWKLYHKVNSVQLKLVMLVIVHRVVYVWFAGDIS